MNKMTIIKVRPKSAPECVEIDGMLKTMQDIVGGYIEVVGLFGDWACIVCNEEGKMMGLEPNRVLIDENGNPYDILCGTFFVVGTDEYGEEFESLTEEQIAWYMQALAGSCISNTHDRKEMTGMVYTGVRKSEV